MEDAHDGINYTYVITQHLGTLHTLFSPPGMIVGERHM